MNPISISLDAELWRLNERILHELEKLPAADPFTLSVPGTALDADAQIQDVITRACLGRSENELSRLREEYFAAGPIERLLGDETVTEIIVNGEKHIWVEKAGRLEKWPDRFLSPLTFRNFIARLSREAGVQANLDCPFVDGHWRGCRVHLIIPPASGEHAVLTLRRHSAVPWTLDSLAERDWATKPALDALATLVAEKRNFLVIGATGSGKTSVLGACLGLLSRSERALIIEDTSELPVPNDASSKLLTRRDPQNLLREVDQSDLLRQAMRMRPDRLIMGEIRGGEAKDLLMAFATGHSGCMGTLHAETARQALLRLEMLIQLGAPQWSLHAVRTLIWLSLHAIVVVGRAKCGARRLEGIYKIASLEDVGFLIEKSV